MTAEAALSERRGYKRLETTLEGMLKFGPDLQTSCDVLDVSISGVRVLLKDTVPLNSKVTLILPGSVHFGGEVVWRHNKRVGLRFKVEPEQVAQRLSRLLDAENMRSLHA
ncbi:PilZ domain-containing protein [Kiloniella sp. b19]|uniref:PilZ domain-containing protein n=1 Tax=Kiloniella sp. GXU_MW_B19 TaxID=3141326 RepID=UPI0031D1ACF8